MEFSNVLKRLREKENLSQAELAKEVGIPQSIIAKYEKNQTTVTVARLIKLADFFNVSVDYMLGRE